MYAQMPIRLRRASFATNRIFLALLFLAVLILAVITFAFPMAAQETGVSQPPPVVNEPNDDATPPAKPSPSKYETTATPASQPELLQSAPITNTQPTADTTNQPTTYTTSLPALKTRTTDPDAGIVGDTPSTNANTTSATVTPSSSQTATDQNTLPVEHHSRYASSDADGDIVHPRVAEPGEILEGTTIRVRLADRLSSASSEQGTAFKSRVVSDVLSNGQILIPTGSEIDGQIIKVSSGQHLGSSGYMRLRPETVILPDGSSYHIASVITGTPGSNTKLSDEGTIKAGSRFKRDGIEYAGVVTAGTVTGAVLGGPVGALAGGAVGAGVVTTHILVNHAQAVLEPGSVLIITLTSPLRLNPLNAQTQN
jgi:type IV secretory pathway VirB10-like protein